jgi:hypothetical protein
LIFTAFLLSNHKHVTSAPYNDLNDSRRIVRMKTIKLSHLLFSLAVIAALVLSAVPATPAFALSSVSAQTSVTAADDDSSTLTAGASAVVCRKKVIWRDGHRVVIRVCKRVHRPNAQ